jgi:hypothetical protein
MTRQKHNEPTLYSLRCRECGHFLARTPSGFLAYPLGHGKLIRETDQDPQAEGDDERCGAWFGDDLSDTPKAA